MNVIVEQKQTVEQSPAQRQFNTATAPSYVAVGLLSAIASAVGVELWFVLTLVIVGGVLGVWVEST